MTASLRLFRIEARRSLGLLLFLPFAAGVWGLVRFASPTVSGELVVWSHVSDTTGSVVSIVSVALAGLAAWTAGRAQRAKTEDLLATTPLPAASRELASWVAIVGWGVFGLALGAGVVLIQASLKATWGGPLASPLATGVLASLASASWGFAAGTWFPGRFTAPLSAVIAFLVLFIPAVFGHPIHNLSAVTSYYDQEFWQVSPDLTIPRAGLLLGLTALAVGVVMLKRERDLLAVALTSVAGVVSLALVAFLLGSEEPTAIERVAYEPLCSVGSFEVCIHPAYSAVQDETVDVFERLTAPLAGIPGAPIRAEQIPIGESWYLIPDRVIRFHLNEAMDFDGSGRNSLASQIAGFLAYGCACCDETQEVVRGWLLRQAGIGEPICEHNGDGGVCTGFPALLLPELERFAALPEDVRDAWLHDNYAALIRGELALEDLPR